MSTPRRAAKPDAQLATLSNVNLTITGPATIATAQITSYSGATLAVNGETIDLDASVTEGYAAIDRLWRPGDRVRLDLDMQVDRLYAHPEVREDVGRVALRRGPLIYCAEAVDNGASLNSLRLPRQTGFEARFEPDLLQGVVTLNAEVEAETARNWNGSLYRSEPPGVEKASLKAVPYFAWDNREAGEMLVWLRGE